MTPHIDDITLMELSLGSAREPHLEECAQCRRASDEIAEALHLLTFTLPPVSPPFERRVRLFAALAGPVSDHADALARMFELPEPRMRALLGRIVRGTLAWTSAFPDIDHHVVKGEAGRTCGLFRVAPGVLFPHHRHIGEERMRILQGSCSDSVGVVLGPGDEHVLPAGTAHALQAHDGPPLVLAYVSHGTEFTGLPL